MCTGNKKNFTSKKLLLSKEYHKYAVNNPTQIVDYLP